MARSLLCIEPDNAAVKTIRRAFEPYGFRIESIPNGEQAIEWARTAAPVLVILSVEPRKVGYAICNKLKRSPSLREIPLILISAEETMATFEQHKKLKSRAEEYLLKPLDVEELLAKADRLVGLGAAEEIPVADSDDIEIADDDISEISENELDLAGLGTGRRNSPELDIRTADRSSDGIAGKADDDDDTSLAMLGDLSKPTSSLDSQTPSPFIEAASVEKDDPFDSEQFDRETQAAFAALEAGAVEGGTPAPGPALVSAGNGKSAAPKSGAPDADLVDLRSLWSDDDLPDHLAWEQPPTVADVGMPPGMAEGGLEGKGGEQARSETGSGTRSGPGSGTGSEANERGYDEASSPSADVAEEDSASLVFGPVEVTAPVSDGRQAGMDVAGGFDPAAGLLTPPPDAQGAASGAAGDDPVLAGLGTAEVPPLPEEVIYDERAAADAAAKDEKIADLERRLHAAETEKQSERQALTGRTGELQGRIESLEAERQTLRQELDELREHMTHAANQGAFSKERDLLGLREIINRKEKDILDLRDGLDAKERQILDHKDKIREHERARRDLEERTLGFEKSLVAANERVSELARDKDKSVEREKGLKARLDDAHEELRKSQDEIEGLRRRIGQTEERARNELERTRLELEARMAESEEAHRSALQKTTDERAEAEATLLADHQAEVARMESGHRAEVEGLQRRFTDELTASAERLQTEVGKLRREHEKILASLKEEQGLQLASERQSYEAQTEAKQRSYRDEIMALRRRHEEELAAAEERRQRDVAAEEQRRLAELEQAESRRRGELQARDEEHHARVTELERRHLTDKTEVSERYRGEHDQTLGRAARAEGELAARAQEIEQAYRRLAGFEADLDATRAELADREVKLAQARDRVGELEAKLAEHEGQVVRSFARLRSDEKTTEKVRRALAVALALLDERTAAGPTPSPQAQGRAGGGAGEEAEKS
jgi:CheY-like chemotaxis protein/chromosome segregation ATPase